MRLRAVHFGPGGLGLGLVVPALAAAGFSTTVVGRSGEKLGALERHRRYLLSHPGTSGRDAVTVEFDGTTVTLDGMDQVATSIDPGELVLVTTALNEGQAAPEVLDAIERIVSTPTAGTVVVPCENLVAEPLRTLLDGLSAEPHGPRFVARTVVDRMCSKPIVDPDDRTVVVACEAWCKWVIESLPECATPLAEQLARAGAVVEFSDEIDTVAERKRWFVNGLQLGVAVHSYIESGHPLRPADNDAAPVSHSAVDRFVHTQRGGAILDGLIGELLEAWKVAHPGSGDEIEQFAAESRERVRDFPTRRSFIVRSLSAACSRTATAEVSAEAAEKLQGRLGDPLDALRLAREPRGSYLAAAYDFAVDQLSQEQE